MFYPIGFTYKWTSDNDPTNWVVQKVTHTDDDIRTLIVTSVPENSGFYVGEELEESVEEIEQFFMTGEGTIVPALRRRNNL